jgi:flavin reductase (DIM6/NTAB) family NADH-FMN oxidoreductase RutF
MKLARLPSLRRTFATTMYHSARRPFKETEAERPAFDRERTFEMMQTPDTEFKAGQGLNNLPNAPKFAADAGAWRDIVPESLGLAERYKLLVTAITPRPIAFVSSMSAEGDYNLAPFSYFNMVSHNPPTVMVSIQNNPAGRDGKKDTAFNILQTKEFCVSIISEPFVEASNYTAIDTPPGTDEWALAGLTKKQSDTIKPPYVAESAFSMECELSHSHEIVSDDKSIIYTMVLGRVKRIHAKEFIFDPKDKYRVMPEALMPVARLGGLTFARVVQGYDLARPRWDDVKDTDEVKSALGKL